MARTLKEWELHYQMKYPEVAERCRYLRLFRKGSRAHLEIECLVCGTIFTQDSSNHGRRKKNTGCPTCARRLMSEAAKNQDHSHDTIPLEEWERRGIETHDMAYRYISMFREKRDGYGVRMLELECLECGLIFTQQAGNHINGAGCPKCARNKMETKGEYLVAEALSILGVRSIQEYKPEGCRYKRQLSYDFYLPEHNCLIEYQGQQHYKYVEYFHKTQEGFEIKKKRDAIKKQWAEENGYLLLRIPYTVKRLDLLIQGLVKRLEL